MIEYCQDFPTRVCRRMLPSTMNTSHTLRELRDGIVLGLNIQGMLMVQSWLRIDCRCGSLRYHLRSLESNSLPYKNQLSIYGTSSKTSNLKARQEKACVSRKGLRSFADAMQTSDCRSPAKTKAFCLKICTSSVCIVDTASQHPIDHDFSNTEGMTE